MSIKNKSFIVNLFLVIVCLYFTPVYFSESDFISAKLVCDNTCVKAGKILKVKTFIESDSNLNVRAFKFVIRYDRSKFSYNNFTAPRGTSRRNFNVRSEDDLLYIEYMCKKSSLLVNPSLDVCNFTFDSRTDTDSCMCKFEFLSFEVIDGYRHNFSLLNLNNLTANIESEAKPNCHLSSLVPTSGKLVPSFNKDILEYDIYVSHDTSFIDFDVCCENEFASSSVSRRKLSSVGKDTKINIIVNDKRAKCKNTYVVNVHRCEKPDLDEKVVKNTSVSTSSSGSCRKPKKSKSKSLDRKLKSYEIKSEDESPESDDTENTNDSNEDYVLLDDNKNSEDSKNYFDERLMVGIFGILVLGGILVYKMIIKNK